MLKRLSLVALASVTLLGSLPAGAQYYDPYRAPPRGDYYERGPRGGYDDDRRPRGGYDDDRRPRRGYDDNRRQSRDDFGSRRGGGGGGTLICVTSRGNCPTYSPINAICKCEIPGFGDKRGNVHRR